MAARNASRSPSHAAARASAPVRLDPGSLERARRALRRRDPALGRVIRDVGPCGLRVRGDPYRSLLRSILFQQLAGSAARAIEARLRARYRGRYPAADALLATPDAALRADGLSRQKIAALRAVARAFSNGSLDNRRLRRMSDARAVEALTGVRGVGVWTAHMVLIHALGRPDVLPVGDLGVRRGAQRIHDLAELPDAATLEELAVPWRPWASVAAWYLWRAAEAAPPE